MNLLDHYAQALDRLKAEGNLRGFTRSVQQGITIGIDQHEMLNLASNDYLGLASETLLREEFFDTLDPTVARMSASSSRLLTGNFPQYEQLEMSLSAAFGRSALLFNSGYHLNIGLIPALCDRGTVVMADKLVHASMIDGIRLAGCPYYRYRHNDLSHLQSLLSRTHDEEGVERILVVTESIFSMDGDETDLSQLVRLKKQFPKVMLYLDEAHAIGVRGTQGLGCVEQYAVIDEIDFIVGAFGKAMASVGGYVICHPVMREYLINRVRPLIFSTALAPMNIAWTHFMFRKIPTFNPLRQHLQWLSAQLRQAVLDRGYVCPSSSHIVPVIIGDSHRTVLKAQQLQAHGFYIMPVRPPTVALNGARLRICLNAQLSQTQVMAMVPLL